MVSGEAGGRSIGRRWRRECWNGVESREKKTKKRRRERHTVIIRIGLKRSRKTSVFVVAWRVHRSHNSSDSGSATKSYSRPSMASFGPSSGGCALGSSRASLDCAGRRPRCSRHSRRRRVAAWRPAWKGWPSMVLSRRSRSSMTMASSLSWLPIWDF